MKFYYWTTYYFEDSDFEITKDYHQQQEQSKKQNMIRYMVIIWQVRDL